MHANRLDHLPLIAATINNSLLPLFPRILNTNQYFKSCVFEILLSKIVWHRNENLNLGKCFICSHFVSLIKYFIEAFIGFIGFSLFILKLWEYSRKTGMHKLFLFCVLYSIRLSNSNGTS